MLCNTPFEPKSSFCNPGIHASRGPKLQPYEVQGSVIKAQIFKGTSWSNAKDVLWKFYLVFGSNFMIPLELFLNGSWTPWSKGHFTHETESPWPVRFKPLLLVEKAEPLQVHFTLHLRDQWSMWMHDGCKVYKTSNGSCFVVTWTIFKSHLLEVGLTQKNMRSWHFEPSQPLIYYILSCVRIRLNRIFLK